MRNEEHNLSHCLESVRGLFDEIVIVNTGSTDQTVEIAKSFGARVFDFPWVDDFAAARNAALARATGDYTFWLDADDVIEPPEREKLERLLRELRPTPARQEARRPNGFGAGLPLYPRGEDGRRPGEGGSPPPKRDRVAPLPAGRGWPKAR